LLALEPKTLCDRAVLSSPCGEGQSGSAPLLEEALSQRLVPLGEGPQERGVADGAFERFVPLLKISHLGKHSPRRAVSGSNDKRISTLYSQMNSERISKAAAVANSDSMDRRIIRVELPPAHAGVTAALRRAFASVPASDEERHFQDLLARLG
jgi:hypothetical protein